MSSQHTMHSPFKDSTERAAPSARPALHWRLQPEALSTGMDDTIGLVIYVHVRVRLGHALLALAAGADPVAAREGEANHAAQLSLLLSSELVVLELGVLVLGRHSETSAPWYICYCILLF